jgi:hypothetical protein
MPCPSLRHDSFFYNLLLLKVAAWYELNVRVLKTHQIFSCSGTDKEC